MKSVSNKKKLSNKIWKAVSENLILAMVAIIVVSSFFLIICSLTIDSDTNFILYEGKRIANGGIQYWNTASVAGKMRTVVQQWLYDLIAYKIYSAFGWRGMFAFNLIQAVILGVLLFQLCKASGNGKKSSLTASLIALLLFTSSYGGSRPEMITGILLVTNAIFIEKYANTSDAKYLIMCMPLVTLEANLHASMWIMHVILMLPYAIPYDKIAKKLCLPNGGNVISYYKRLPVAAAVLAMPAFALANPYGTDGLMYLFNSAGMNLREKAGVIEMQYPRLISFKSIPYLVLLFFAGKFIKKTKIEHNLLFAGSFCIFGMAMRNIMFLSLAAAPLSASVLTLLHIESLKKPVLKKKMTGSSYSSQIGDLISGIKYSANEKKVKNMSHKHESIPFAEIGIYASVIAVCIWITCTVAAQPITETDTPLSPIKAETYIKAEKKKMHTRKPARIMTRYSDGAYFERMGEKIFIDARPEIWRKRINGKADIYDEYISTKSITQKKYTEIKKKYRFDYILAPNESILQVRCQNDPYAYKAVQGNGYTLYQLKSRA